MNASPEKNLIVWTPAQSGATKYNLEDLPRMQITISFSATTTTPTPTHPPPTMSRLNKKESEVDRLMRLHEQEDQLEEERVARELKAAKAKDAKKARADGTRQADQKQSKGKGRAVKSSEEHVQEVEAKKRKRTVSGGPDTISNKLVRTDSSVGAPRTFVPIASAPSYSVTDLQAIPDIVQNLLTASSTVAHAMIEQIATGVSNVEFINTEHDDIKRAADAAIHVAIGELRDSLATFRAEFNAYVDAHPPVTSDASGHRGKLQSSFVAPGDHSTTHSVDVVSDEPGEDEDETEEE